MRHYDNTINLVKPPQNIRGFVIVSQEKGEGSRSISEVDIRFLDWTYNYIPIKAIKKSCVHSVCHVGSNKVIMLGRVGDDVELHNGKGMKGVDLHWNPLDYPNENKTKGRRHPMNFLKSGPKPPRRYNKYLGVNAVTRNGSGILCLNYNSDISVGVISFLDLGCKFFNHTTDYITLEDEYSKPNPEDAEYEIFTLGMYPIFEGLEIHFSGTYDDCMDYLICKDSLRYYMCIKGAFENRWGGLNEKIKR